ncbi:MAG: hypothetical protein RKO68_12165, partial [Candidatus Accumulibacter sp.]|nr:hypothetical protein [Accumulibacter sp.]
MKDLDAAALDLRAASEILLDDRLPDAEVRAYTKSKYNKRPRSKLRGIGLPKNAASCGEWTRR